MDVDVLKIATRTDRKLHGEDVAREIDALHASGTARVFAVVATAGTTNLGIIDDINSIADVAHDRNIWFHVDGAYGLAALCAPKVRAKFNCV
jgi:glutamate/tyrosine decarboxylase-like PLP-dependent enzyme